MASIVSVGGGSSQPVNTGAVSNGSYTVPAGKYARVSATLSTYIAAISGAITSGGVPAFCTPGQSSHSVELFLKSGDVLSVSNVAGNINSGNNDMALGAVCTASLLLNGTLVSRSSSSISLCSTGGTTYLNGSPTVNYSYAEYLNK